MASSGEVADCDQLNIPHLLHVAANDVKRLKTKQNKILILQLIIHAIN